MHKYIKDLWTAALRSGLYQQGTNELRDSSNNFCCLGVLCNIHAEMHPKLAAEQKATQCYFGHGSNLPPQVMSWAGLQSQDPKVTIKDQMYRLSAHNDGTKFTCRKTFLEIADAIEAQL